MDPKIAKRKIQIRVSPRTNKMKLLTAQCHRLLNMKKNREMKEEALENLF